MNQEQIKWEPKQGQLTEAEARTLGINPVPGIQYRAYWIWGRPLIIQQEKGVVTMMPEPVQSRAFTSCGFAR